MPAILAAHTPARRDLVMAPFTGGRLAGVGDAERPYGDEHRVSGHGGDRLHRAARVDDGGGQPCPQGEQCEDEGQRFGHRLVMTARPVLARPDVQRAAGRERRSAVA